jgi:serpin B
MTPLHTSLLVLGCAVLAAAALVACNRAAVRPTETASSSSEALAPAASAGSSTSQPSASAEVAAPAAPPPAPPAPSAEIVAAVRRDNLFAFDLYGRIRGVPGNLVCSPLSIATALGMTWVGARGQTAAEMAKVLHLDEPGPGALEGMSALASAYRTPDPSVTLRMANRLFLEKSFVFDASYVSRVEGAFGASLEPVDFVHEFEASRGVINAWVAKETDGRILDLLPHGSVDRKTRLVLTNAIYFLGEWATTFPVAATRPAPFSTRASSQKDVPTMHTSDKFRFVAADGVKLLELPYRGLGVAKDVILPDDVDGLGPLEARLSLDLLNGWLSAAHELKVVVSLPKFTAAPASPLALKPILSAMGMPLVFTRDADLGGIGRDLDVSEVFHKAFVKVDEKGTEAAAATAVIGRQHLAVRRPVEFRADHPFLFLLRDLRTGLVLFMGRVADPASD